MTGTTPVTPVVRQLRLAPLGDPLRHRAGQYVLLGDPDYRLPQRSYSLANAPRPDGRVALLVTRVAGGATSSWAHHLRPGDDVVLDGPYGTFVTEPGRPGRVLLLAAPAPDWPRPRRWPSRCSAPNRPGR